MASKTGIWTVRSAKQLSQQNLTRLIQTGGFAHLAVFNSAGCRTTY